MHLDHVLIRNFRGLQEIEFDLPSRLSVIVGPNAIGKTSVLEAIRLAKSVLAEGYDNEGIQVLQSLGAFSPVTGRPSLASVLGDAAKPLRIRLSFRLDQGELNLLRQSATQLATTLVRGIRGMPQDEQTLVRLLSSPEGQGLLTGATTQIEAKLNALEKSKSVSIALVAEPLTGLIRGEDLLEQLLVAYLARSVPPAQGLFSYFPADRAMPMGEVPIQLGVADMQQQLFSHMGNPAQKYQRLKNYVVTRFLSSDESRKQLREDFDLVFSSLLNDKQLKNLTVTPVGLVSIVVREPSRGIEYDIDNMSSGEKGLVLTFMLLRRACAAGGVILLDEPELHLNPSVIRRVVPFLMKHVLEVTPSQAIVCTHAPEIIADAYNRDDCTLLHLRSPTVISVVRRQDKAEIQEALKRLGVDTPDVLAVHGTIFVEGKVDYQLLEIGFPERLSGYRVVPLGGRAEVEKEIKALQAREQEIESPQCFIFDLDNRPAGLTSKGRVRVAQWDRYCFENYLLEDTSIFDVLATMPSLKKFATVGEVRPLMKELALSQLPIQVAKSVFHSYRFYNPGFRTPDEGQDFQTMAEALATTVTEARDSICSVNPTEWKKDFVARCKAEHGTVRLEWEEHWRKKADGKKILADLHREFQVKLPISEFKKRIMLEVARAKAPSWREVDSILAEVIPPR